MKPSANDAGFITDTGDQYQESNISRSRSRSFAQLETKAISKLLLFSNIMTWFGLMIFCYIITRFITSYLDYKRAYKYIANDAQDIEDLCIRSFLIYVLGNIALRFETEELKQRFVCFILYFLATYTVTSEYCPNIEIGGNGMMTDIVSICIVITIAFMVIYTVIRNGYSIYYHHNKLIPRIWIVIFIILFAIHFILIAFGSQYISIHIHHHYWCLLCALFCRSSNKASFLCQSCFIAMFIHGIAVYGCEPLFNWINVNTQYFQKECDQWLCPVWKCVMDHRDRS